MTQARRRPFTELVLYKVKSNMCSCSALRHVTVTRRSVQYEYYCSDNSFPEGTPGSFSALQLTYRVSHTRMRNAGSYAGNMPQVGFDQCIRDIYTFPTSKMYTQSVTAIFGMIQKRRIYIDKEGACRPTSCCCCCQCKCNSFCCYCCWCAIFCCN